MANSTSNKINKFHGVIEDNVMNSIDLANLFINYFGAQILTEDFFNYMRQEGYFVMKEEE